MTDPLHYGARHDLQISPDYVAPVGVRVKNLNDGYNESPKWKATMPDWQSIETAPKDGTEVILFVPDFADYPDNPVIITAFWDDYWQDNGAAAIAIRGNPTHWMPTPKQPKD